MGKSKMKKSGLKRKSSKFVQNIDKEGSDEEDK